MAYLLDNPGGLVALFFALIALWLLVEIKLPRKKPEAKKPEPKPTKKPEPKTELDAMLRIARLMDVARQKAAKSEK